MLDGSNVTNTFHRLNTEMSTLRTSLRDEIQSKLDRINTLTSEISALNVQYHRGHRVGHEYRRHAGYARHASWRSSRHLPTSRSAKGRTAR